MIEVKYLKAENKIIGINQHKEILCEFDTNNFEIINYSITNEEDVEYRGVMKKIYTFIIHRFNRIITCIELLRLISNDPLKTYCQYMFNDVNITSQILNDLLDINIWTEDDLECFRILGYIENNLHSYIKNKKLFIELFRASQLKIYKRSFFHEIFSTDEVVAKFWMFEKINKYIPITKLFLYLDSKICNKKNFFNWLHYLEINYKMYKFKNKKYPILINSNKLNQYISELKTESIAISLPGMIL